MRWLLDLFMYNDIMEYHNNNRIKKLVGLHSPALWSHTPVTQTGPWAGPREEESALKYSCCLSVQWLLLLLLVVVVCSPRPSLCLPYNKRSEAAAAAPQQPPPPHMELSGLTQLFHWKWIPTLLSWGQKASGNQVKTTNKHACRGEIILYVSVAHDALKIFFFPALTVRLLTRRFIGEYGDIGESNFHSQSMQCRLFNFI